jgi:hypothetical protein
MTVLRGMRIDNHPADRVTHAFRDLAIVRLALFLPRMVVTRMTMRMMLLGGCRSGLRHGPPGATARFLGRMVGLACCGRHRASFMKRVVSPTP